MDPRPAQPVKRLLLVPPDTRPVTLKLPTLLAEMVGVEVGVPPEKALPHFFTPGDPTALRRWLLKMAPVSDVLVVCLETLTLGGMIPARRVSDPLEDVLARLEVLRELKALNPQLKIYAFGVVVRVAHDNDPHEEKPYYGEWGAQLRAYGVAADRLARHGEAERPALEQARAALPPEILADWLGTRQRNHALHLAALDLVREGVIGHLCLTLDDTAEYGLAALDRRALEQRTDELALWRQVDIYPGADEVPCTLIARALRPEPVRVWVIYSGLNGHNAGLIYEDRPAGELVRAHLRAAGCRLADTPLEADFVLMVNTPGHRQANRQPDFASVDTAGRHLPAFVDRLAEELASGRRVALADIAYPNGAEQRLWTLLQELPLARLAAYSAWNTAGNTLGSAVAFGKLAALVTHRAAQVQALFSQLVDDGLYQAFVRGEVRARLEQPSPYDLGGQREAAERELHALITPRLEALWRRHFAESGLTLEAGRAQLAWPRLFTGAFELKVSS
ncbi:hypothetical protein DKM44_00305 [Deinococcus irradiatisoli]|uniref:DUF4127 domain-containing protein n=1 Tax=Deinococcus irradiatisoli TaxID=2202254 RepID=A0A2Z3J9T0_9DEIO|nr:DUF4127 family protein [Deinococcus irradiatisoli]AWN21867.1 hypothetical protein DKM44_00305 [Deinococcus irradiatisoli]